METQNTPTIARRPVYTRHADELVALYPRIALAILDSVDSARIDSRYTRLVKLRTTLERLIALLRSTDQEIAYIREDDLEDLIKIVNWQRSHPTI